MYNRRIVSELCSELRQLTGCDFSEINVLTDRNRNEGDYIPTHSLKKLRPIIITNIHGNRLVFIPHEDWDKLMRKEFSVSDYVSSAIWHYGYYWGAQEQNNSGLYWTSLENGKPGIHDKEKVRRYLTMLRCRAYERCNQEPPMMIWCSDCHFEKCPMSSIARKRVDASWEYEVQEQNVRKEFCDAISLKLKNRFGLEVCKFDFIKELDRTPRKVYLFPGYAKDTVKVSISEALAMDIMYHPKVYTIDDLLDKMKLEACVAGYNPVTQLFYIVKTLKITKKTKRKGLEEFWGKI